MVKCKEDPTKLKGQPIGMYHCPECGEMLIAGIPHLDYDNIDYSDVTRKTDKTQS